MVAFRRVQGRCKVKSRRVPIKHLSEIISVYGGRLHVQTTENGRKTRTTYDFPVDLR